PPPPPPAGGIFFIYYKMLDSYKESAGSIQASR
ncbi:MAG: hypothetical protein RL490_2414, partial [Pseudomonadota bacterium]